MTPKRKQLQNIHSQKEINQIYQNIHNWMRQAHKEMNPATAAALTTALVWSNMIDAILVRAHADSNCKSISDFTSHCIENKGESIRVKF
jgi:hypothetical protein